MSFWTVKFKQRTNGNGAVNTVTTLALSDTAGSLPAEFVAVADPLLKKVAVRVHYFPSDSSSYLAARRAAVLRADALKSALNFRVPQVRPLARGKVSVPNIYDNFGDLVYDEGSPNVVILDNCTLFDVSIDDDGLSRGVTLVLTFGRPADILVA